MADYSFEWGGHKVELKEASAWRYADAIEDVVCLGRLIEWRQTPADVPFARLAQAVAALLSEAGIKVDHRQMRAEMVKAASTGAAELREILNVIDWLLLVVNDGIWELADKDTPEGGTEKKDQPA